MYFWRIDRLKVELRSGGIGDREVLPYILIWIGLGAAGVEAAAYLPYESITLWTYAWSAMVVALPVLGAVAAYRANGGASGVHFANRYFTLGFVLLIRLLPLLIPAIVVLTSYWIMSDDFTNDEIEVPMPMSFVDVLLFGSWLIVYNWRLAKHVSDVAKA